MKTNKPYLRIGTDYYKKAKVPLHSGDILNTLLKWKKSEIVTDEGKDYLTDIEKYDGFCLIPSHTDYKQTVKNFYNNYEEIDIDIKKGEFEHTKRYLYHIFGEHFDLAIDYLAILWHHPTQILPILCLVSSERNTGKTTFLLWLKMIFQGNMTINKNEDFRSRFNSDWSSKLIIAVDETLLDKKEDSERIKNLSTASFYKTEAKGADKVEGNFFGKFILCSNNEDNFIYVDKEEIRYWVLKVPVLKKDNPNLLERLKEELPMFLYYIDNYKIKSIKQTRMWFTREQIYTDALANLVKGNRTYLDKEIKEILVDDFIKYETDTLQYSLGDLVELLSKNNIRVSTSKISYALKHKFELESKNGNYTTYYLSESPNFSTCFAEEIKKKGRFFTFNKKDFIEEV